MSRLLRGHSETLAQASRLSPGYSHAVKILDRIRRIFSRSDGSPVQSTAGGTVGTQVGLGQVEAAERGEFPPEELAVDEPDEAE
jgi:hypothetical protein